MAPEERRTQRPRRPLSSAFYLARGEQRYSLRAGGAGPVGISWFGTALVQAASLCRFPLILLSSAQPVGVSFLTGYPMPKSQLRMTLGGKWSVSEFRRLLKSIEGLYNLLALPIVLREQFEIWRDQAPFLEEFYLRYRGPAKRPVGRSPFLVWWPPPFGQVMRSMPDILGPERSATIAAIHLESPGVVKIDLGIAELVKEIRDLIRWASNGRTADKLQILERKIGILRDLGYSPREIRSAIRRGEREVDVLLGFVEEGKLLPTDSELDDRPE